MIFNCIKKPIFQFINLLIILLQWEAPFNGRNLRPHFRRYCHPSYSYYCYTYEKTPKCTVIGEKQSLIWKKYSHASDPPTC